MKRERRQHRRAEVNWPVTMRNGRETIEGEVQNICEGGALIYCQELPEITGRYHMFIKNQPALTGTIVRVDEYVLDDIMVLYGVGVQFK